MNIEELFQEIKKSTGTELTEPLRSYIEAIILHNLENEHTKGMNDGKELTIKIIRDFIPSMSKGIDQILIPTPKLNNLLNNINNIPIGELI